LITLPSSTHIFVGFHYTFPSKDFLGPIISVSKIQVFINLEFEILGWTVVNPIHSVNDSV